VLLWLGAASLAAGVVTLGLTLAISGFRSDARPLAADDLTPIHR
jgi:hypothetical protein